MHIKTMNNKSALKLIIFLVPFCLVLGCASFPKNMPSTYLNASNINDINGKYAIKEFYSGPTTDTTSSWNFSDSDLRFYPTLFDELDNRFLKKAIVIDNEKRYCLGLEILNSKKIKLNFIKEDHIFKQKTIRYKLKDDGYIYLSNNNFKSRGIPYIIGDFNKKRIRFTLNKDNDLLFETSEFSSGGLFLLMVYPISKLKYEKIYQRLK